MSAAATIVGVVAIAFGLRDVFHTVLHPGGHGSLSDGLQAAVWRLFRVLARPFPALLALAGPVALAATLGVWATLVAVGWALVLWPHLPQGFLIASGLDPAEQGGFADALYVSFVTLSTLGYGDIAPRSGWLRILGPLEAFVGFSLITAAISWILSVYPVLARRRSLARRIALIREGEPIAAVKALHLGGDSAATLLDELTTGIIAVEGDLSQFPVTYYFHGDDDRSSLCAAMPHLVRLAADASSPDCPPAIRLRGAMLQQAIQDFAAELGGRFLALPAAPVDAVLRAYAADHDPAARGAAT